MANAAEQTNPPSIVPYITKKIKSILVFLLKFNCFFRQKSKKRKDRIGDTAQGGMIFREKRRYAKGILFGTLRI
jgi:hypothetical protein